MKEIYKILISVFTILMLTSSIGIAAKPTPTPTPIPTPNQEQIQDSRLTSLETNDTLQQINNTEQQGFINGLINDVNSIKNQILSMTDQINQLVNRVTNLENNQNKPFSAVFGSAQGGRGWINSSSKNYKNITNITFYLPVPAYVYVQGSGQINNYNKYAGVIMKVDNGYLDGDTARDYAFCYPAPYPQDACGTGFQTSKTYYMTGGTHTIYLLGYAVSTVYDPFADGYMLAIANENGTGAIPFQI